MAGKERRSAFGSHEEGDMSDDSLASSASKMRRMGVKPGAWGGAPYGGPSPRRRAPADSAAVAAATTSAEPATRLRAEHCPRGGRMRLPSGKVRAGG